MNWVFRIGVASVLAFAVGPAAAQESSSPLHNLAKAVGLATDPPPPPDYVLKSRPVGPTPDIPVFQTPEEPTSQVRSKADLEKMDADLESVNRRHDALRSGFGPSAKAMAADKAARAAKDKHKGPKPPEKP